jgi:hypothetical protein
MIFRPPVPLKGRLRLERVLLVGRSLKKRSQKSEGGGFYFILSEFFKIRVEDYVVIFITTMVIRCACLASRR